MLQKIKDIKICVSFCAQYSFAHMYNQRLLQDLTISMCGYYVLYFVIMESRGAHMYKILSLFHPRKLRTNNRKVWSLVQRLKRT